MLLGAVPDFWQVLFVPAAPVIRVVARGSVMYLTLFFALRVLRRQAGTLGISDLLMVVLLADAAQNAMAGPYSPITEGLALVGRSGSAFLYSETGRDQWTGERGHAAAASGCGKK